MPVENSVCCALYNPDDISTFGMRGACETLETEIEGAEVEVFFELSPPACYKMVPSVEYLDLDGDKMYDMENDQLLKEFDMRMDLDEDECCRALLEDEALDIYWDYACRTFEYESTSLSFDSTCQSVLTSQKFYFLPSVLGELEESADFDLTAAIEEESVEIAAEDDPVQGEP